MSGTNLLERKLGNIDFAVSQTKRLELRIKPNLLRRLQLRSVIGITVSSTGGTAVQDNPMSLIKAITLSTNDGKTLKRITGPDIYFLNKCELGTAPFTSGVLSGAISANAYTLKMNTIITFENLVGQIPELTILNTNAYPETLNLEILWGSATDLVTANTVIDTCVTDVIAFEREPISQDDITTPRPELVDTYQEVTVAGSGNLEVLLPDKTEIKTIAVRVIDNSVRSDTLVTNVQVQGNNGTRIVRDMPFEALQMSNKELYGVEAIETGIAIVEFDPDGDLEEIFSTLEVNNPKLVLTCGSPTGTAKVFVLTRQVVTR